MSRLNATALGTTGVMLLSLAGGMAGAAPTASGTATTGVVAAASAPGRAAHPSVPRLRWRPCHAEVGPRFECARARVPLDYDHPRRRSIRIALIRVPATDPDARIGSLFINPGGPGLSGVQQVLNLPVFYGSTPAIAERFDLIGFDTRGIGGSTRLACWGNNRQRERALDVDFSWYPLSDDEEAAQAAVDKKYARACARRGGRLNGHMSTANVARDLDLLRRAVGDDALTFAGYSYGTFLAATYANLFPDRVRAILADAVVDPIANTGTSDPGVPLGSRQLSGDSMALTFDEYFRLCDASTTCALAPGSHLRFDRIVAFLDAVGGITVIDPRTGQEAFLDRRNLYGTAGGVLYEPNLYPQLTAFLAGLEAALGLQAPGARTATPLRRRVAVGGLRELHRAARALPALGRNYDNHDDAQSGILCEDTIEPTDPGAWPTAADQAALTGGPFGRFWAWWTSECAGWPQEDEDRYLGPWDAETANPVLLIGNAFDPATRYENAVALRGLLPSSALLTVDIAGHISYGWNICADRAAASYLLDPETAAATLDGTTCPAEYNPFDQFPGVP